VAYKWTKPERDVAAGLRAKGLGFENHCRDLPGTPDFVFRSRRIALFVDGDFWHGWEFFARAAKLSEFWKRKIRGNMDRDRRVDRELKNMGWTVVRVWEHDIERRLDFVIAGIVRSILSRPAEVP
jgi:DNA mismatch endonuclease (patch repair protein)